MTQALERPRSSEDQVVVYYDRTWEQFKHIQKGLEDHPGVRLSFYAGVVEVFMPGQAHEIFKKVIAALLEAFFEVIFTSGSATKLQRYRALGVPEVWCWEDDLLTLHRLGENGYTQIYKSQIPELANLDIALLSRCVLMGETNWLKAMRTFRNAISND